MISNFRKFKYIIIKIIKMEKANQVNSKKNNTALNPQ